MTFPTCVFTEFSIVQLKPIEGVKYVNYNEDEEIVTELKGRTLQPRKTCLQLN